MTEEGETKKDIAWQQGYKAGVDACNPGGTIVNLRGLVPLDEKEAIKLTYRAVADASWEGKLKFRMPIQQVVELKPIIDYAVSFLCAKFGKDNRDHVFEEMVEALKNILFWKEISDTTPELLLSSHHAEADECAKIMENYFNSFELAKKTLSKASKLTEEKRNEM